MRARLDTLASGGAALDPATLAGLVALEGELIALEQDAAREDQHPLQAAATDWSAALARAGLQGEVEAIERVVAGLDMARLRALELAPDARTPSASFEALLAVDELLSTYSGRPRGLAVDPAVVDAAAVVTEGYAVREQLRRESAAAVAAGGVPAGERQRWVELAVDAADEALFSAGEATPREASDRMERAAAGLGWHAEHLLHAEDRGARARLARARARLETEREEQLLAALLERRFGARRVTLWDRAVLVALVAVLALLAVDWIPGARSWARRADHALCAFFLWDFAVRAWHVGFRRRWLQRHFVTDLLPALPWTWMLAGAGAGADPARAGWLLRLLRLPRMAQSARILVPLARLVRALGFLARGLDRVVRRHGRLLEREVLLFPNSEERRAAEAQHGREVDPLSALRVRVDALFEEALSVAAASERVAVAHARNEGLAAAAASAPRQARRDADEAPAGRRAHRAGRPLAEALLESLARATPGEVDAHLGEEGVRRVARGARLFARSPLRHFPIARSWVPRESLERADDQVAAGLVRAVARAMRRQHDRVLWWADLATTITPAELVGRVGATIVARTARPAVRLLLFAGAYGLLYFFFQLVGAGGFLETLLDKAKAMLGPTLLVLGTICLVLLAIGAWLQRLARDVSTFQDQVASAQFLHLTDSIKARHRSADARLLARRVFAPERRLQALGSAAGAALGGVAGGRESDAAAELEALVEAEAARFEASLAMFLGEGTELAAAFVGHDPVARAVLLYRDHQGGALLVDSDTRATGQLLGNLALRRMIERSGRLCAADLAALARIDLVRRKSLLNGPYLWFHAITRALASRAARQIVDFNGNAIPTTDLGRCSAEERASYEEWLVGGPAALDLRNSRQLTSAFTILHFLDASPARDAEVERRFGIRVRTKLEHERRELVRSVLGCWPLASRPLEERVLNLRVLYDRWIAGGRILLLPARLAWHGCRLAGFLAGRVVEAVQVIRRPERALGAGRPRQADFATALRKIDRMRLPAGWEALRLRARFDPFYLGFRQMGLSFSIMDVGAGLTGARRGVVRTQGPGEGTLDVERDLEFLRAEPELVEEVALLRARTARDIDWMARACEGGLLARLAEELDIDFARDPERLRALFLAFHADFDGVRAKLAGEDVVLGAAREARDLSLAPRWRRPFGLRARFQRWWGTRGAALAQAAAPEADEAERKAMARAAWVAVSHDLDGARAAFLSVERDAAAAAREGERLLGDLLRHPAQLTEQLTTLRTVQATTLIDVRNYRQHVHALGRYEVEDPRAGWARYLDL